MKSFQLVKNAKAIIVEAFLLSICFISKVCLDKSNYILDIVVANKASLILSGFQVC